MLSCCACANGEAIPPFVARAANEANKTAECLRLKLLVGIGPAKSGSSALADMLIEHAKPYVEVGNAALGHRRCCGPELYHFLHEPDCAVFSQFFITPFHQQPRKWRFEKTPWYSDHTQTPFYLRTMSRNVKLLFTYRSPILLDVSLYRMPPAVRRVVPCAATRTRALPRMPGRWLPPARLSDRG